MISLMINAKPFTSRVFLPCLLTSLVCLGLPGRGDEISEKGREVMKTHQSAVVTIQLVVKSKWSQPGRGAQSSEFKKDVTGAVVDPSGLTVVSLADIDPSEMYEGEDRGGFKLETELGEMKILMEDGSEVPTEVVLRDKDLDLAFMRPKAKPATPMAAVDLANSGSAQLLDQVITINRLGQAANRAFAASIERICGIIQKPRLFYLPDSTMTASTLGCPAFTMDGKTLGIFVLRSLKSHGSANQERGNATTVILPAEAVLKAAKQAPEASEESKEEKK